MVREETRVGTAELPATAETREMAARIRRVMVVQVDAPAVSALAVPAAMLSTMTIWCTAIVVALVAMAGCSEVTAVQVDQAVSLIHSVHLVASVERAARAAHWSVMVARVEQADQAM